MDVKRFLEIFEDQLLKSACQFSLFEVFLAFRDCPDSSPLPCPSPQNDGLGSPSCKDIGAAGFLFIVRTAVSLLLLGVLTLASAPPVTQGTGGLLRGSLAITTTGLPPASELHLSRHTKLHFRSLLLDICRSSAGTVAEVLPRSWRQKLFSRKRNLDDRSEVGSATPPAIMGLAYLLRTPVQGVAGKVLQAAGAAIPPSVRLVA